ncbi:hypothetical protein THOM_2312 [Trachipleistophora hominis]|uniref:Uncharacterized protein n=1 Tax=Trachipleistophora hominis TaxID=72359 RepID=L7JUP7_TRAHO|nr:hypothetical protein THOM_2312 [Trachipleistophora hominis]
MFAHILLHLVHLWAKDGDEKEDESGGMTPVYVLGFFLFLFVAFFIFLVIFSKRNR